MLRSRSRILPLIFLTAVTAADAAPRLEDSIVRIVNYSQRGTWYTPWEFTGVGEASGSGFVVEGGMVMTNAHVVSDSRLLLLFVHNRPDPLEAEVVHIAHDADLALVRPVDPGALDGVSWLPFGETPALRETVYTLGYPMGGKQVSSTRGVVSRIEERLYVHSGKDLHLTVQTDAAINPGNSGGPVVKDGHVVGVAFQANLDLQSVGYFIPMEVVGRFLRDVEDGHYDGYPELGTLTAGMENPAARTRVGMEEGESGVRVYSVWRGTSADGRILPGDVILSIDDRAIGNDGSVPDGNTRMPFGLMVDRKQIGEQVTVRVLRKGKRKNLEIPLLGMPAGDTQGHLYDHRPRYFVYAGLVFVPLNREVLKTFGNDWRLRADKELLGEYIIRPLFEPDRMVEERVVLLRRFRHAVNADMAFYRNQVVERVNGRRITSLEELAETLENHKGDFHLIEFSSLRRIGVLDRHAADEANVEILEQYGIVEDRNL